MLKNIRLCALTVASAGCAQLPLSNPIADSPESVVPAIAAHFSACNLDTLVAHYAPTIEFTSPSTLKPLVGRAEVGKHFSGACTHAVRPIMKVETQRVRMLSATSAVVTGTYSFGRTDQPAAKPWPAFFVITLVLTEGRWLINTQATFPVPEG
jgi:ketosteroid isomerase-like protein